MLEFGNKEFRNLQEQVGKNQDDILGIKQSLGNALPDPIPGPEGPQGKSIVGPAGERGNSIFGVATELPNAVGYKNGDFFLLRNGDLYKVVLGKWQLQTSLRGPQGISGDGTDVEANPENAASDVISKISINGIIYEVASAYEAALSEYLVLNGSTIEVGGNIKVNNFENIVDGNNVNIKQYITQTVDTAVEDQIFRTNLSHAVILKTSESTFTYNNWSQYYRADGTKINTEEEFNEYVGEMAYLNPQFATPPNSGNRKILDIPPATWLQRGGGFIAICSASGANTYKLIRHTDFDTYFHDQDFLITPELDIPDWCYGVSGGIGGVWIMLDSKLPLQTKYSYDFTNSMIDSLAANGYEIKEEGSFKGILTIDEHHLNIKVGGALKVIADVPYNVSLDFTLVQNNILNQALGKIKRLNGTPLTQTLSSYNGRVISICSYGANIANSGAGTAKQCFFMSNSVSSIYYYRLEFFSGGAVTYNPDTEQVSYYDFDKTFVLRD